MAGEHGWRGELHGYRGSDERELHVRGGGGRQRGGITSPGQQLWGGPTGDSGGGVDGGDRRRGGGRESGADGAMAGEHGWWGEFHGYRRSDERELHVRGGGGR